MSDIEDLVNDDDDQMISSSGKILQSSGGKKFSSSYLQRRMADAEKKGNPPSFDLSKYSPKMQKILSALPLPPANEVIEAPNAIEQSLSKGVCELHDGAVDRGEDNYTDPDTGYFVFTRLSHIKRGRCCGSACRHCPYGHANVSADRKLFLKLKQVGNNSTTAAETKSSEKSSVAGNGDDADPLSAKMMRMTKSGQVTGAVYTRTGDKGTSGLFSGERRPKSDPVFAALGTVDELNSTIGAARVEVQIQYSRQHVSENQGGGGSKVSSSSDDDDSSASPSREILRQQRRSVQDLIWVQERLLDCGALIAMASSATASDAGDDLAVGQDTVSVGVAEWVRRLEQLIDAQNKHLPPLVSFILPCGGTRAAAQLHVSRSVCRRAERCVWEEISNNAAQKQHVARCEAVVKFLNRLSDFLFTSSRLWSSSNEENSAAASEFTK